MGDEDYVSMLEDSFIPEAWARFGMKTMSFLYDRKSYYPENFSSSVVRSFFKDHVEFEAKPWPMKSRDLSPFPTIWSYIEKGIHLQRSQPTNALELFQIIEELWMHNIARPEFCKGLLHSLHANLEKVALAEGDSIE